MSIDAIKAVVDLIEMGGVVGQEDIVKCLRSAIEQAERQESYWQEEARRYAGNADFWREKAKRQPLTDEQLDQIYSAHHDEYGYSLGKGWEYERAIERAHGIRGEHD
jgi:hypothetical protein